MAARAQQGQRVRRVGLLIAVVSSEEAMVEIFQTTLRSLGWIEGRNLELTKRLIGSRGEGAGQYAKEIVDLKPDVVVAGPTNAVLALQRETNTVPIVFIGLADVLEQRIVPNLTRPGGNLTGFSGRAFAMVAKALQLFREVAPGVTRIMALFQPASPVGTIYFQAAEAAARSLDVKMTAAPVGDRTEIEHAITEFARQPNGRLYLPPDTFTISNRDIIVDLAAKYHLPSFCGLRVWAQSGGLMSYDRGNRAEDYRGAALYVDRILRGEKPGDLPVQQPTRFEFVLNLKTAKALGLTVPPGILAIADDVFE
jgi:putative ABC transport system substrate-binding protein